MSATGGKTIAIYLLLSFFQYCIMHRRKIEILATKYFLDNTLPPRGFVHMPSPDYVKVLLKSISTASMLLLLLAGCGSGPKTFEVRGDADQIINRDTSGNPLSVVVHVYQLRDSDEFSKMTFDTLAGGRPAAELLGKDLLEKNEVLLVPGATYASTEKLREEAKHIGVVAFFRHPEQHYWRFLVDANAVRKNGLQFRVSDCFLSLTKPKPSLIPGQPENAVPVCNGVDVRSAATTQSRQGTARQSALPQGRRGTATIRPALY